MTQVRYNKRRYCNTELETDDLTAVMEIVNESLNRNRGRPCTFSNDEGGLEAFRSQSIRFFQRVDEVNRDKSEKQKAIPDVDLWATFLGVTRHTISNYEKRGPMWKTTIEQFKGAMAAVKKQLAFRGRIPALMAIFDLTNNHQYRNTSEFHLVDTADEEPKPALTLEELPTYQLEQQRKNIAIPDFEEDDDQ